LDIEACTRVRSHLKPLMAQTPTFFGREQELAWLRSQFDAATSRDGDGKFAGPRLAVILAETGLGKSRLVQELYLRLARDERWDPPEANYWPDAYGDVGAQLRVNPDMHGHQPGGPPRYMWLGVRWQPTDRRNVDSRSALPDLRSEIGVHMSIIDRHRDLMSTALRRAAQAAKKQGVGEFVGQVADAMLPFGGLALKLVSGAKQAIADRISESRSYDRVAEERNTDISEDLLECFEALLQGRHAVPAVLWLDDAQWIDAQAQQFVQRLWAQAQRRRWPLLIVATHWEREWRELVRAGEASRTGTLAALAGHEGVHLLHLPPAGDAVLSQHLLSRLPGLAPGQQQMLLQKAAGNFLTMTENIADLCNETMNFVNDDLAAALSAEGEEFVATWESERSRRVEQRFKSLRSNVKNLLGWSSRLGVRFLHGVVADYATRIAQQPDGAQTIEWCVDPGVILGAPGRLTREFRDRAFHVVAARHFNAYGKKHVEGLMAILRHRLVHWVGACFDAEGRLTYSEEALEDSDLPPDSAAALLAAGQRAELRDVLDIALRELPLPDGGNWGDPQAATWLRAVSLATKNDADENLWSNVRDLGKQLASISWHQIPLRVLGTGERMGLAQRLQTAGVVDAAQSILVDLLARAREQAIADARPESSRQISICLGELGTLAETRGDLRAAVTHYAEALEIDRTLCTRLATPDSRRDLAFSLYSVGNLAEAKGDLQAALTHNAESLEIRRELCAELGTPSSRRDLAVSLTRLGDLVKANGDLETASTCHTEALTIFRALCAELATPDSRRDVSVSLSRVGDLAETRGDLEAAQAHFSDALEIDRTLCVDLRTPASRHDVSLSLTRVGDLAKTRGDLETALTHQTEALTISRALCAELGTPASRRDVSVSLSRVGGLAERRGDLETALTHYADALAIARALCAELGTPNSQRDVSLCLYRLANLAETNGDLGTALDYCTEALAIDRAHCVEAGTLDNQRELSVNLTRVGDLAEISGDLEMALTHYADALAIARALCAELGTPDSQRHVSFGLYRLANLAQTRGEVETAQAHHAEALAIRRSLRTEVDTPDSQRDVSMSLLCLGHLAQNNGDLETALTHYTEMLVINRALCAELGASPDRRSVWISLSVLGDLAKTRGDLETALTHHSEALAISRALCAELGTSETHHDLLESLDQLSDTNKALGESAIADAYAMEADALSKLLNSKKSANAECPEGSGTSISEAAGNLDRPDGPPTVQTSPLALREKGA